MRQKNMSSRKLKEEVMIQDTLKAFHDYKNKQKPVQSDAFRYVKVYIF